MDERLQIAANHPANRWEETRVLDFLDCVLVIEARAAGDSLIVLQSRDPLRVASVEHATATLREGWDGTLGYSLYGLSVKFDEPGIARVALSRELPPTQAQVTSEAEVASWRVSFEQRPSRFPDDESDFISWQTNGKALLQRAVFGGAMPQPMPPKAELIKSEVCNGFTLLHMRFWSTPQRQSTLLLSQPNDVASAPLLVGLHGHEAVWGGVEPAAYNLGHIDDFCAHFARAGWAVLQPATMDHELQDPARTLHGEWLWDIMQALSAAIEQPFVDAQRIAVCGLSTGGSLAKSLLALDLRVRAGVVGSIFSHWRHYDRFRIPPHCDCGLRHQIEPILEQVDWLALAAPKPVQLQHGRLDAGFCPGGDVDKLNLDWNIGTMPAAEFDTLVAELQRGWRIAGAANPPAVHIHDQGHRVDGSAALDFLNTYV